MLLTANTNTPVSIYYCKAGIKTGLVVRVQQDVRRWQCRGVTFHNASGEMQFDNATGAAKRSGARCILHITSGTITLTDHQPLT